MTSAQARSNAEQAPDLQRRQFLTVAEVASLLRVSRWTVGRWIDRGELAAIKVGAPEKNGAIRIPINAVPLKAFDEFVRRHTITPSPEEGK